MKEEREKDNWMKEMEKNSLMEKRKKKRKREKQICGENLGRSSNGKQTI